jgi:hypothetical protein
MGSIPVVVMIRQNKIKKQKQDALFVAYISTLYYNLFVFVCCKHPTKASFWLPLYRRFFCFARDCKLHVFLANFFMSKLSEAI